MHDEMVDLWRDGQPEEAERLAHTLLSFGNLPVLYRVYAHIVSGVHPEVQTKANQPIGSRSWS